MAVVSRGEERVPLRCGDTLQVVSWLLSVFVSFCLIPLLSLHVCWRHRNSAVESGDWAQVDGTWVSRSFASGRSMASSAAATEP